jgi:RimJ/RimL family protein N-acetyltransferase
MSSQTWLQTPRLSLRRFTEDDREWMRGYYADEEATRFLGGVKTPAQVDARIVAIASLGNVASHRVLDKIGLHRRGERTLPHPAYANEGPMAWFERDADDWIAERGSARDAAARAAHQEPSR